MSKLGENIKRYRKSKGLTQEQLANLLGYKGKSAVANWEKGYNSPTDDKIEMMLDIFGVDANTLYGWYNAAQIKSDAEELANMILKDVKVSNLVETLKNISPEDMDLVISFAKRLRKEDDNK
jgi:transcriptional regulator with XRE-family HTH domain